MGDWVAVTMATAEMWEEVLEKWRLLLSSVAHRDQLNVELVVWLYVTV